MSIDPTTAHQPRRFGFLAGAFLLICLLAVSAAPFGHAAAKPGPWIELASGSNGNFLWTIKAESRVGLARKGLIGPRRPCLLASAFWQTGELKYHRATYRQCATAPVLPGSGPPLVATVMRSSAGTTAPMSAVGMIFAPAARRARVTLAGGKVKALRLRELDSVRTEGPSLGHLRYAAFAIHGTWCAERLVSFDASGAALWDSGVDDYRCGAGGPPTFAGRALSMAGR